MAALPQAGRPVRVGREPLSLPDRRVIARKGQEALTGAVKLAQTHANQVPAGGVPQDSSEPSVPTVRARDGHT